MKRFGWVSRRRRIEPARPFPEWTRRYKWLSFPQTAATLAELERKHGVRLIPDRERLPNGIYALRWRIEVVAPAARTQHLAPVTAWVRATRTLWDAILGDLMEMVGEEGTQGRRDTWWLRIQAIRALAVILLERVGVFLRGVASAGDDHGEQEQPWR